MNEETLARQTCTTFLTAAQLGEICRRRGFGPPDGNKYQLAAYVAARFTGSEGVSEAMRSLEEPFLTALHSIAFAGTPSNLDDLDPILNPNRGLQGRDTRGDFNRLAGNLLNRGL